MPNIFKYKGHSGNHIALTRVGIGTQNGWFTVSTIPMGKKTFETVILKPPMGYTPWYGTDFLKSVWNYGKVAKDEIKAMENHRRTVIELFNCTGGDVENLVIDPDEYNLRNTPYVVLEEELNPWFKMIADTFK